MLATNFPGPSLHEGDDEFEQIVRRRADGVHIEQAFAADALPQAKFGADVSGNQHESQRLSRIMGIRSHHNATAEPQLILRDPADDAFPLSLLESRFAHLPRELQVNVFRCMQHVRRPAADLVWRVAVEELGSQVPQQNLPLQIRDDE